MQTPNTMNALFAALSLGAAVLSTGCVPAAEPRIYVYESDASGFNTRTVFYDNGEEVVAVDTQFTPELAEKAIAFLRTKTARPLTYAIVTHPNPDKFDGIAAFQAAGAKVVASRRTVAAMPGVQAYKQYYFVKIAGMFTDETYPKLGRVDLTFDDDYALHLGNGEILSLRELAEPGVSANQTVVSIPRAGAVVVGDLVHYRAHAWLEGAIIDGKPTPNLKGWIADLEELRAMFRDAPKTLVYGGRGEATDVATAVDAQIAYLRKADALVARYVDSLGEKKSELLGDQAGRHYAAIQAEFEREFADYALGYMIQYGVYGLVNSKL